MNPIVLLTFTVACALAAPATYVSSKSTSYTAPAVTILKQINQLNDDGSYTFGYEASDGSFRVENMDVDGYITGRYGYVDAYGQPQETEYVAGKLSGQSVGYQARGTLLPETTRSNLAFPFVRTSVRTAEQKALDYEYASVDDDEDGIPDPVPVRSSNYNTEVVRLAPPAKVSHDNVPVAVRVVDSAYPQVTDVRVSNPTKATYETAPTVVRVTKPSRIVAPAKSSSYAATPTVVRVADPYADKISEVRLVNPTRTTYDAPATDVRLVAPSRGSYRPNFQTAVRVAPATRGSYQSPTVVRVANSERVQSTGQLDQFLRGIKSNIRNIDNYNTYDATGSVNFVSSASPIQVIQDDQEVDDSVSIDSLGFSRII